MEYHNFRNFSDAILYRGCITRFKLYMLQQYQSFFMATLLPLSVTLPNCLLLFFIDDSTSNAKVH